MDNYSDYTAYDFFLSEDYIEFVKTGKGSFATVYKELSTNSQLYNEMEIAKTWILMMQSSDIKEMNNIRQRVWINIQKEDLSRKKPIYRLKYFQAAASVLLIIGIAAIFFVNKRNNKFSVSTNYGKLKNISLPDSSEIELFGHTNIVYGKKWGKENKREVWLKNGEADFSIKHTAVINQRHESDSFKVHVNNFIITVMGTKFRVADRNNKINVDLREGKVRINGVGQDSGLVKILHPGESFEIDIDRKINHSYSTPATLTQSWAQNEISLNDETVGDLLDYVHDVFGYEVSCDSPEILSIELNGYLPSQNINLILTALNKMTNTAFAIKADSIIVYSKK